ncbi:hypothetical protein [Pseudomonas sp. XWY-1]|uniref:hypothetical protein n=1 Tax=Pseudomonas sp. XWY-1 TaxID=2069256 RepID=UPI0015AC4163|nr:hypothetical protein [Pseudomonas sp. XWY-1]
MSSEKNTRKRAVYWGVALLALIGGALAYNGLGLSKLRTVFSSATPEEIEAATRDSRCASRLLVNANRSAQDIRVRDLEWVKERCALVERQAEAFEGAGAAAFEGAAQ